jgi:hypothetical protein
MGLRSKVSDVCFDAVGAASVVGVVGAQLAIAPIVLAEEILSTNSRRAAGKAPASFTKKAVGVTLATAATTPGAALVVTALTAAAVADVTGYLLARR